MAFRYFLAFGNLKGVDCWCLKRSVSISDVKIDTNTHISINLFEKKNSALDLFQAYTLIQFPKDLEPGVYFPDILATGRLAPNM